MGDELTGRNALEEAFFAKENQRLLDELRSSKEAQKRRTELAEASGIQDPEVLERLEALEIGPETVTAMALVPLIVVAWSDGEVDQKEREAVLHAAHEAGIREGSAGDGLLANWLAARPPAALLDGWKQYVAAVAKSLSEEAKQSLEKQIMGHALEVAKAAGNFLTGGKISSQEQRALDDLASAFKS